MMKDIIFGVACFILLFAVVRVLIPYQDSIFTAFIGGAVFIKLMEDIWTWIKRRWGQLRFQNAGGMLCLRCSAEVDWEQRIPGGDINVFCRSCHAVAVYTAEGILKERSDASNQG